MKLRDKKSHKQSISNLQNKLRYDGFNIDLFKLLEGPIEFLTEIDMRIYYRIEEPLRKKNRFLWRIFHNFVQFIIHPVFRFCCYLFGDKSKVGYDFGTHEPAVVRKESSYPYKPITFEDVVFMGPNNPINFCKEMYGSSDYMNLPKKEQRNPHGEYACLFDD